MKSVVLLLALLIPMITRSAQLAPDIIIFNANIHTMDQSHPRAEAIAIAGNRIAALGSTEEIRALAGKNTRLMDAAGQLVLPGFNDAHVHFLTGGFSLSNVDLRDASSPRELAARLAAYAEKIPKGRWILGGDWDHEKWPGAPLPTRQMVDEATPSHPVFINRLDGHMALANSLALKLAGVTKDTKDVPGGLTMRDNKTAKPTGSLKDAAENPFERGIPP